MLAGLALLLVIAGPHENPPVRLRDMKPGFVKGGRVLLSRTATKPGLFVGGRRYRGLNCPVPSRVGLHTNAAFSRLRAAVAVLDGGTQPVAFKVVGDGRTLLATPPLFPGAEPLKIEVDIEKVLLLELVAEGPGKAHAAWIGGWLDPTPGRALGAFRALDAPFSPGAYPTEFRRRVNTAIDSAAKFLLRKQKPDGSWDFRAQPAGATALATLALLKAGVKPETPAVRKAFDRLRKEGFRQVYTVSCTLLALEARYFPGGASEKTAYLDRPKQAKHLIPAEEQVWIRDAADWLSRQQGMGFRDGRDRKLNAVWRYPHGGYDLSNTQYALLGLSAANRCGVPTRHVWLPALRFLLRVQEKEGPKVQVSRYFRRGEFLRRRYEEAQARGFGYVTRSAPTGSMTSAGLCSLIFCHQALDRSRKYGGLRDKTRAAMRDALAWLEEYYDVEENPFQDGWWQYYLFNLERVGVLLDQRYIGTRDWYREGSEALMRVQRPDGSVAGPVRTSFALLFWKRATVPAMTSPLK